MIGKMGKTLLNIDTRGEWSHRQAEAVIRALEDEARLMGVELRMLDISTHDKPHRALIHAFCREHKCVIEENAAQTCWYCPRCYPGV